MNTKGRVLISGWFSFDLPHNTAGDLLAKQSAISWAEEVGYECFVAVARPEVTNEVVTDEQIPGDYDALVFVCGPLTESHLLPFIKKFKDIKRIALNVSIVDTSDLSKEFDVIIPRDSRDVHNPDISLATPSSPVPVVGLIYVGQQREYPTQQHEAVEQLVNVVLEKIGAAKVMIDTRLPHNQYGLTSIDQVESTIRKMDIVITTRLHGAVLSLRNGTPPVVIDSVPEGAKVTRQMQTLNWPLSYTIANIDEKKLTKAIQSALESLSKELASEVVDMAERQLQTIKDTFIKALN